MAKEEAPVPSVFGTIAVVHRGTLSATLAAWLRAQPRWTHVVLPEGEEIARQRNWAAQRMQGEWLLFVDSDCLPPSDTLARLLLHHTSLVGGVILERRPPFDVCAVKTFEPTARYRLEELPAQELVPVLALGTGCLLIQREVFEALPPPWFRVGQLVLDCLTEDTEFCLRAAERGFIPHLDCGVRVGHSVEAILWPHEEGAVWGQWEGSVWREPLSDTGQRLYVGEGQTSAAVYG